MEFGLLGRLLVESEGVDLTPTRPKQRALLAALLLRSGEVIPRDALIEALWGDDPPATAATALHGHVSALRRRLGAERIESRPPGYRLRLAPEDSLDVRRFEEIVAEAREKPASGRSDALSTALALFRGEPLEDVRLERFAGPERSRLEELRLVVLERKIDADLELGRQADLVPILEQLVAEHPFRERLREQLMLVLYRLGRQAEALQLAQEARRVLVAELGIDPGPALQRLEYQILNQDPELVASDVFPPGPPPAASGRPAGIVTYLFARVDSPSSRDRDDANAPALLPEGVGARLRSTLVRFGGLEVDAGDGWWSAVFGRARDAAASAVGIQRATWPAGARVAIGIHSAEVIPSARGYIGPASRLVAGIASAAHGGQIVLAQATRNLLRETPLGDAELVDLGDHRLTDLGPPQRLSQLLAPGLESQFPPLRSLEARSTNLPAQATPLIGREHEIGDVLEILAAPGVRLVTLTGVGGTGKTRLALHVAADLLDEFTDGVFFVSLGAVADPDLVVSTIARTLDVGESGGETVTAALRRRLRDRRVLLILDNFEHLIPAAAAVGDLLETAPEVKVLTTSRASLRLAGERVYRVTPLGVPRRHDPLDPDTLLRFDAVALFASRAGSARPEFVVNASNADDVATICRALDGLPLAIELAAARVGVLPPAVLSERLEHRLKILASGPPEAPDRHRGLRAMIDWSYELLVPDERLLFARLSVFAGGCTLDGAERVCGDGIDVVGGLAALVDQSLVRLEGTEGEPRFSMLETIRESAAERLAASGEDEHLRRRHAEHFLAVAEMAEPHLRGSPGEWPARLERDHDNLLAALDWFASSGERQLFQQLAGSLWRFWYLRGHLTEGRRWLEDALGRDERPTASRARALIGAAVMAVNSGDLATAKLRAEAGITLHGALGDAWGGAYCQFMLGAAARGEDDLETARRLFEESIGTFRELGDEHSALLVSRTLAWTYQDLGGQQEAQALHEENLRQARATGNDRIEASTLGELAEFAFNKGRVQDAVWMLKESLRIHRDLGDRLDTAVDIGRSARALAMAGHATTAVQLVASLAGMLDEVGVRGSTISEMNDETLTAVRRQLDGPAFDEAWRQGQELSLDEAVALALDALQMGHGGSETQWRNGLDR